MAEQQVESEMSGVVVRIECTEGGVLAEGDAILVIEAMKMEMPLAMPVAARVVKLLVAAGDTVTEGQPVATIEPA